MYAIVQLGSTQYKISEGDTISAHRLAGEEGKSMTHPVFVLPITVDERGFVFYEKARLPCRYLIQEDALEFQIKDRRAISSLGKDKIAIPVIDFARLAFAHGSRNMIRPCPRCISARVVDMIGVVEHGRVHWKWKCLYCGQEWPIL